MTSIRLKIEESWYASMDCKVQKLGPWVCFYGGHSTGYKLGNHPKNIEPCAHRATTPPEYHPPGSLVDRLLAVFPLEGRGVVHRWGNDQGTGGGVPLQVSMGSNQTLCIESWL